MAITPDTKDWTWVLERPCPDCGFDASAMQRGDLAGEVLRLGSEWQNVVLREGSALRVEPDKWSALEYACHVRDVFTLFAARISMMLAQDGASFENWDQDATAREQRYEVQDPAHVARELEGAALALSFVFATIGDDQWANRGLRSNGSEFTVETLGLYFLHDPIHHLWDVSI